ncbi:uncharacterized protein TRAVEDRAFT_116171, partial [Trametes versicolor FP-101664 SS1]|uniref:uncharacterized protein n=1 Tax=Trametes versicolor (strain FP-101664) TaxID=717944 RepID=UPI0004622A7B
MPRFLHTWTGAFVWVEDPKQVSYAILSHTWRTPLQGGEQSYDHIRIFQDSLALYTLQNPPTSPIDPPTIFTHCPTLSDKIKGVCYIAREAGYQLLWMDSCCIDKSSSSELSEAINSMYEWYRLADVCYVYLEDVPIGPDPTRADSKFRTSRWHTRGWTLQELIGAERVVFLSNTWRLLGTKMGLAPTLAEITGVDHDILTGRVSVDSVSVARRMSWAAGRQTTRIEDQAYCLMGLFRVHMSPIYGEGTNAFLRLQEAIIRTIPDQTIFAW